MRSWFNSASIAALLALSIAGTAGAATYEIDPAHTTAVFSVRHMMVSNVRGELGPVSGTVNFDDKDPSKTTIEATIDATAIDTHMAKRDSHLKSADFLDVVKFPNVTFKSTKAEKAGPSKLKVSGDLTIRGVSKPVVLDVEYTDKDIKDPSGHFKRGATASTKISRKDFGLNWNVALEGGGVLVGDEVSINLDVELGRKDAKTVTGSR